MKKIFFVAAFAFAGLTMVSCSSDDSSPVVTTDSPPIPDTDTPNPETDTPDPVSLMVGTWKATTLSYSFTIPGQEEQTHQFPFDHASIKGGCATDYLTVEEGTVVNLKQNNKNEEGNCVDVNIAGTWTEDAISITGETQPREVISFNQTELVLKYEMTFNGRSTAVTVQYTRQ